MNLANKLTMLRIFLVPFFLVFMAIKEIPYGKEFATFIFVLAAITDQLDGYIARSRNQVTTFGKFMDPLADKLLVTAALISLVELHVIYTWVAVVIISREFAVSGLRTIAASEGKVIAASWWGKIKTVIQIVAIVWALVFFKQNNYYLNLITSIMIGLSVIVTIISGIDYFSKNKSVIKSNK